jgi:hypothetical protein
MVSMTVETRGQFEAAVNVAAIERAEQNTTVP